MSWKKRELINQAFDEIGLGISVLNTTDEMYDYALRRLDTMMAAWEQRGIDVDWPHPTSPELSILDDETLLPQDTASAVWLNLAVAIAPSFGKQVPIETKAQAREAYNWILSKYVYAAAVQTVPTPTLLGAGAKSHDTLFTEAPP